MSKNKKKDAERTAVKFPSLFMKPTYACFVMHCNINEKCSQILLDYAPKIGATDCVNYDEFIYMVGGYGSMIEEDYNRHKTEIQENGMGEFDQLFFSLMDELREVLKPLYKNALLVEFEGPGFVVFADTDSNED